MALQLRDALAATKAFVDAKRGDVVAPEEVLRRANACTNCPARRKVRVWDASMASKILGMMANKNRVPSALKDYKCGVCNCSLLLLVPSLSLHADSPAQAADRDEANPDCWVPEAVSGA